MMDWVPIVFVTFKVVALGTAMFFAIKWHHDQSIIERQEMRRAGGVMAAVFVLLLLTVVFIAFSLGRILGLDLGL